jgi:O-antigen ligase
MHTLSKPSPNSWIAATLGIVLVISPLLRFSWDIAPQTVLHLLLIPSFLIFITLRVVPFTVRDAVFLLFITICSLSIIGAPEKAAVRGELLVLFDGIIAAYLYGFLSEEQKRKLLVIPLLAGLWLSVVLLFNFLKNPLHYFPGPDIGVEVLLNLNVVAGYLVLCLPYSFLQWSDQTKESLHYRILSAFLFAGIVLTASRAAIAVAAIIFVIYAAARHPDYRRFLKYAAALTAVVLVLLTLAKLRGAHAFFDRLNWWRTAISMSAAHPLTGVGWGNFGNCYLEFRTCTALNTLYAHNLVLQILAETGVPGILAFITVMTLAFRNGFTKAVQGDTLSFLALLSAGGFLLLNLVDYSFYIPAVQILFWVSTGALVIRADGAGRNAPYLLPAMLIVVLLLAYLTLIPFIASVHAQRGLYFLKKAEPLEALTSFGKAAALDPLPSLPYSRAAETYFALYASSRNPAYIQLAIEKEQGALKRFPNNARYWSDLSWLYRVAGDNRNALTAITNAVIYDHCNPAYGDARRSLLDPR